MRLTTTQREVLQRMAAGEHLCDSDISKTAWLEGLAEATVLPRAVLKSLEHDKLVKYDRHFYHIEYYRLTPLGLELANEKAPPK